MTMATLVAVATLVSGPTGTWDDYGTEAKYVKENETVPKPKLLDGALSTGTLQAFDEYNDEQSQLVQEWDRLEYRHHFAVLRQQRTAAPVVALSTSTPERSGSLESVVCSFAWDCATAMRVVMCESGGSTSAVNGQYLGAWQMGDTERATYGHGYDLYSQTAAAHRYYQVSGWSPWSCY